MKVKIQVIHISTANITQTVTDRASLQLSLQVSIRNRLSMDIFTFYIGLFTRSRSWANRLRKVRKVSHAAFFRVSASMPSFNIRFKIAQKRYSFTRDICSNYYMTMIHWRYQLPYLIVEPAITKFLLTVNMRLFTRAISLQAATDCCKSCMHTDSYKRSFYFACKQFLYKLE